MGRRLEYEVKTSVRLNMSNPQHVKINDVIQNLDPKIFKSKNQFIIDGTKVYSAGDVVAESLTTGTDGQVVLSDLHLGTYVVTEIKSIDGYTINTTPQTVAVEYKDQTVTVQYESTTIENTRQKADVSVVKKDSDTENPLDGGKYTLYAGNDIKNYELTFKQSIAKSKECYVLLRVVRKIAKKKDKCEKQAIDNEFAIELDKDELKLFKGLFAEMFK